MGARGPKPEPTKNLARRGARVRRPTDQEPAASSARPKKPAWLKGEAGACWKRLVRELEILDLLTSTDADLMVAYCLAFAKLRDLAEDLEKKGDAQERSTDHGIHEAARPQLPAFFTALDKLAKLSDRFGLNPSARSRITLPDSKGEILDPVSAALGPKLALRRPPGRGA